MIEKKSLFSRRLCILILVAAFHAALLFFAVFHTGSGKAAPDPFAQVMKVADFEEYAPPPPNTSVSTNASEDIAEKVIETTEVLPQQEAGISASSAGPDYLPMHKISVPPEFDERELKNAVSYPEIARRSGIEGTVYLELFIDREGKVRSIRVLKEDPKERGFAEAAVRAFEGRVCTPALANGSPVAVRYRYPVRFSLK